MIHFSEAYGIVMNSVRNTKREQVAISDSLNRILAQDVVSDLDMPPFDKSAMDGYACRSEDLEHELNIIEIIPAGYVPVKKIGRLECSKIMTGAMLPEGADCVVIVEETEEAVQDIMKFTGKLDRDNDGNFKYFQKRRGNVCYKGEDIKSGEKVLASGEIIKPQHIAVLASVGCANPCVSIKPKVGVIATGSELVEPHEKAEGPKIRNSNSYQLSAQIDKMGAVATYYGIAEDSIEAIDSCLKKAMAENDIILISGGVSMGDYDFVPEILKKNGINILFDQIAIQPGKPTTFGVADDVICFGMPGNPVSTFVQFEILVKPFLYKMMGHDYKPNYFPLVVGKTIKRKRTAREALVPVYIKDGKAFQVEYHGSAHINAMCVAEYLVSLPIGVSEIKEGTIVNVRQI
jgi:molybdopterin molybdotransferase